MEKIRWGKRVLNKILLIVTCLMVLSGGASATSVTVDGILSAGEYTGGDGSGTKPLLWWNGHNSIYTKAAGNMNDLYWEINNTSGGSSLNIFFEVPTYARRMIWGEGIKYNGTNYDAGWGIPIEYLDAYLTGSHHTDGVKMDYGTQTGSEYFQLNGISGDGHFTKWQDEDNNGLTDGFTWKTSREYLISNGICSTKECREFTMTASIEMQWDTFTSYDDAFNFLNSITDMELHLSDEARGLPDIPVPEPATMLLFGIGLLGLAGVSRRKK